MRPLEIDRLPDVSYFGDETGHLIPLIAGSFHIVGVRDNLLLGIYINDSLHPIYDSTRHQILINVANNQIVRMTPQLHLMYAHYFVRPRPNPRQRPGFDNNGKSSVSNKRRKHN